MPLVLAMALRVASVVPRREKKSGEPSSKSPTKISKFWMDSKAMSARGLPACAVTVMTEAGDKMLVTTYAANPIGKFKPKEHYLDWVIKGLKQWKLPEEFSRQWQSYSRSERAIP